MSKNNLVSIIMNCWNGEKYLAASVQSIIEQTYKNWELIFWDNNSDDDSKNILLSFKDKRIKYFNGKKKVNLYFARNKAIKKAKGKYLCFLDTDDLWKSDKLEKQIKFISKKKVKFIYSNYYILKNQKKKIAFFKNLPEGIITNNLLKFYSVGLLTVIMEKNLLKKFKFNKKYNVIGDFDLFIRLSRIVKFYYMHTPLAISRSHEKNFSRLNSKLFVNERINWFKENKEDFKSYNLNAFLLETDYLLLKSYIFNNEFKFFFLRFFQYPFYLKKIKALFLLLMPKQYFNFQ